MSEYRPEPMANPQIEAFQVVLAEEIYKGGPVADILKTVDASFPALSLMHLTYKVGNGTRRIALSVEVDMKPTIYTVFWMLDAVPAQPKPTEMQLSCLDLMAAVHVVTSVLLTEYLKTQVDNGN